MMFDFKSDTFVPVLAVVVLAGIASPSALAQRDLDDDYDIDQADLRVLIADCASNCVCDLDGDDDMEQADLGILLAHWGMTCP